MKRTILLLFVVTSLCVSSCSNFEGVSEADAFVGTYSVSVEQIVTWGYSTDKLYDSGTIRIKKVSPTKIKVSGYISTTGEVVGNYVYLEGGKTSDSSGYITTNYGVGKLEGGVLIFTANQIGELKSNGVMYPFSSSALFTCVKK